jgi:hypothetical protein
VWCVREMVVERRGGRAAVPSAVMDGNGWMGRGAGDELMRWRAHSMGAVGARAASHRAALRHPGPATPSARRPPPLIRGSPSRGDPTRQRGGARRGAVGGGQWRWASWQSNPSQLPEHEAGWLASEQARTHAAVRGEGIMRRAWRERTGGASDRHRAPEGCRAPPPALRACPRGHRSRA